MMSAVVAGSATAQTTWPQFAGDAVRSSWGSGEPDSLAAPRWTLSSDGGSSIAFVAQAGVVASATRVYAVGRLNSATPSWRLFAVRSDTGAVAFSVPVLAPVAESWSTPAFDATTNTVIVASGNALQAFDATTGAARWSTTLPRSIINASPAVTTDRGPADRVLITDFDGFGAAAQLHCVNIDPFDAGTNPFQPGQIVWSRPIGGSSGNTPAYRGGVVYVASSGDGVSDVGRVLALPITGTSATGPFWTFVNPAENGFFGGVSVAVTSTGVAVFAGSYGFFGGPRSSELIKIDAASGNLLWSIPSNRTSATPIYLSEGFVVLSGGINGFGTVPSVQLVRDLGSSAQEVYDTALSTWADANNNGLIETGEYLSVGGWTHQPIAVRQFSSPSLTPWRLYVGTLSGSTSAANPRLVVLDLTKLPTDAGYVMQQTSLAGGTPAIATVFDDSALFSVGVGGLRGFGGGWCAADCDESNSLSPADFTCFLARYRAGDQWANCDDSVVPFLSPADFTCFLERYRTGCQ